MPRYGRGVGRADCGQQALHMRYCRIQPAASTGTLQQHGWKQREVEERLRTAGIALVAPQDQEPPDRLSVVERLEGRLGRRPLEMDHAREVMLRGDRMERDAVAGVARAHRHPEPEALRVGTQVDAARTCHHGAAREHEDVICDDRYADFVQARKEGALARTLRSDDRPRTRPSSHRAGVHRVRPVRERELGSDAPEQRVHQLAVRDVCTHAQLKRV